MSFYEHNCYCDTGPYSNDQNYREAFGPCDYCLMAKGEQLTKQKKLVTIEHTQDVGMDDGFVVINEGTDDRHTATVALQAFVAKSGGRIGGTCNITVSHGNGMFGAQFEMNYMNTRYGHRQSVMRHVVISVRDFEEGKVYLECDL